MNNGKAFGYFSKVVADRLGIATDTLRSWSIRLEAIGIQFERNDAKRRIYYEKDVRALENMKELLALQQPLDDVAKIIAEKIENGTFDNAQMENNGSITIKHDFSVIEENNALSVEELKKLMTELAAAAAQTAATKAADERFQTYQEQQQRLLPSPEEERRKKFDEMMLHRRIERRLQDQARQEWEKLPESERTLKAGLFGLKRIENAGKRQDFIKEYVDRHYETELRQELDIDAR
jgi:DNA-binding transcriptional MerR regulator